jgi:hypothetical protein
MYRKLSKLLFTIIILLVSSSASDGFQTNNSHPLSFNNESGHTFSVLKKYRLANDASPYLVINHDSMAVIKNGKTDYNPTADNMEIPQMRFITIQPRGLSSADLEGTLELSSNGVTSYRFQDDMILRNFTGLKTFYLWYDPILDEHQIGNENYALCEFKGNAETALSEQPFLISADNIHVTGNMPMIRATQQQMDSKCVPYMELLGSNDTLTGVRIRFVDPAFPEIPIIKNAVNDVSGILSINVFDQDNNLLLEQDISYVPKDGMEIETAIRFSEAVTASRIYYIKLYFMFEDSESENTVSVYSWDNTLVWTDDENDIGPVSECQSGYFLFTLPAVIFLYFRKR